MAMVTPLRITSAPVRRQGSVHFSHWLRPPLAATGAPVQMDYTQSLTATAALINQLAQEHEIPDESAHTVQRIGHALSPALPPERVLLVRILLGQPLFSTASAAGSPTLFGGFVDNME